MICETDEGGHESYSCRTTFVFVLLDLSAALFIIDHPILLSTLTNFASLHGPGMDYILMEVLTFPVNLHTPGSIHYQAQRSFHKNVGLIDKG